MTAQEREEEATNQTKSILNRTEEGLRGSELKTVVSLFCGLKMKGTSQ